jgi:hypothetical protein
VGGRCIIKGYVLCSFYNPGLIPFRLFSTKKTSISELPDKYKSLRTFTYFFLFILWPVFIFVSGFSSDSLHMPARGSVLGRMYDFMGLSVVIWLLYVALVIVADILKINHQHKLALTILKIPYILAALMCIDWVILLNVL